MHRSGTSLVAGLIAKSIFVGNDKKFYPPQDIDNPKGYFENIDFRRVNDGLLKFHDYKVEKWSPKFIDENLVFKQRSVIGKLRVELFSMRFYNRYRLNCLIRRYSKKYDKWGFKDPRTALVLETYSEAFSKYDIEVKYIIIYREPGSVALSLKKRGNANSIEHGIALWKLYNEKILDHLNQLNDSKYIVLKFEELINSPTKYLDLFKRNGIELTEKRINQFIDKNLNRSLHASEIKYSNAVNTILNRLNEYVKG